MKWSLVFDVGNGTQRSVLLNVVFPMKNIVDKIIFFYFPDRGKNVVSNENPYYEWKHRAVFIITISQDKTKIIQDRYMRVNSKHLSVHLELAYDQIYLMQSNNFQAILYALLEEKKTDLLKWISK